jgi:hypothetical protein
MQIEIFKAADEAARNQMQETARQQAAYILESRRWPDEPMLARLSRLRELWITGGIPYCAYLGASVTVTVHLLRERLTPAQLRAAESHEPEGLRTAIKVAQELAQEHPILNEEPITGASAVIDMMTVSLPYEDIDPSFDIEHAAALYDLCDQGRVWWEPIIPGMKASSAHEN